MKYLLAAAVFLTLSTLGASDARAVGASQNGDVVYNVSVHLGQRVAGLGAADLPAPSLTRLSRTPINPESR